MYKSVAKPIQNAETRIDVNVMVNSIGLQESDEKVINIELSQQNLVEAIIWSEILGKPLCKRRKSR